MTRDGRITAARAVLRYQNGAFPAASAAYGAMAAFAAYDLDAVDSQGYDVVTNRPKQAAYRAPGAPMAVFGVECVVDELCQQLGLDPWTCASAMPRARAREPPTGPPSTTSACSIPCRRRNAIRTTRRRSEQPGARRRLRLLVQLRRQHLACP